MSTNRFCNVISRANKRLRLVVALALATQFSVSSHADDTKQRPAPEMPKLAEKSADAATAIGSFKRPIGMTCELFAAEPMVGNPVAFTIDNHGRVVVCESYRQENGVTDNRGHDEKWLSADLAAVTVADRIRYHREQLGDKAADYEKQIDLLRMLIDTDGDMKADKATVYASGFNSIEEGTGAGALVRGDTIYYTNIPKLWALVDKDNDGVADERIVLADGFGVRVAFRGHDMHGLIMGPDGRLYFSIGDRGYHVETPTGLIANPESGAVFRCELDGSKLEVLATGLRNPQELAFDDYGNLFTGDNNSDSGDKARWVYIVRGGDTGWRMMYQYLSDRGPFNREKIWYPFSDESPVYTVPPIANIADGPSGLACYPGTGFTATEGTPDPFQNAFFLCDFRGQASNSGVRMVKVDPKGAFFELKKNEPFVWNILATDVEFAPDGGMYVSDWVNGWKGENKGRIYRFADEKAQGSELVKSTRILLRDGMKSRSKDELGDLLGHADRRVRFEAQWELASRGDGDILESATQSASTSEIKQLHGVWGLGQLLRAKPKDATVSSALVKCLSHSEPMVVSRAMEALADAGYKPAKPALEQLLTHDSAVVKSATCMAVGLLGSDDSLPSIIRILEENNNQDPILRHAGIMGLVGVKDYEKLKALKNHASEAVRVAAVVALRKQANPIVFEFLKDSSAKVRKEAVLAIHDVPQLHSQLPALAELPLAADTEEPVVNRVLNASFRLGREQDANRLASFAARAGGKDSMRVEALEMLANWAKPGDRDRVMNRHQPLSDRSPDFAAKALKARIEELAAAPQAVSDKFLEVGAKAGLTEIAKILTVTAKDPQSEGARRGAAIRALINLAPDAIQAMIPEFVRDADVDVRMASMAFQVTKTPNDATKSLKQAISSKIVRERQFAWDQLAIMNNEESKELVAKGVDGYLNGTLERDCWINVVEAAKGKLKGDLEKRLQDKVAVLENLKESEPKKHYEDCVDGGDVAQGRSLFFTRSSLSCVRCHKVGSTGGEVGPNLSALGAQKSREYLLEAIVAPNAAIAQGFETVVILDEDGKTVSGILKSEDDINLTLMDAQGALIKIPKDNIDERRKGQSSMPVDLLKYLNKRELRDLVAYLATLDGSPVAVANPNEAQGGHKLE
ncbi:MAG: HEAT repeat domain-containing protein [Planctomycetota bacterium]|nr:HEAT repeat domain-containing protein [Planctomycetota bacterium]